MNPAAPAEDAGAALRDAAARAAARLAGWQSREGVWPNRLEGGPYLEILHALGAWVLQRKRQPLSTPGAATFAERLLARQNADGGFALWPGGPSDPQAGPEAWLVLRLAGIPETEPRMEALRQWIRKNGGLRPFSRSAWVRLLWAGASADGILAPEPPETFFFADYARQSALARQRTVCEAALSVASYLRNGSPPVPVPEQSRITEGAASPEKTETAVSDASARTGLLIRYWVRYAPRALRDPIVFRTYDALVQEALAWPTLPVALHAAVAVQAAGGRGSDALAHFERVLSFLASGPDGDAVRPCDESVRDTALAVLALAGGPEAERRRAALLARFRPARESRNGGPPIAGWAAGDLHTQADAETTALVLRALIASVNAGAEDGQVIPAAAGSLAGLQRDDGGWAAMPGEPPAADVTGAVMEALAACGGPAEAALARAARFLEETQHGEGYWRGVRGVCRIHGTAMALRGLRAAGVDCREATVLRAGEWLRSIQNADGGWGESPESCEGPLFREGPSTPAQTAWALLGLLAGGDAGSESVRRGFAWLLERQRADGGWDPVAPTRPGVAYAPYLMDPLGAVVFPLLALRERAATLHSV